MIHAELDDDYGIRVGCKRVARLMRAGGLRGVMPKRFVTTTIRDAHNAVAIDLVDWQFKANGADQLWSPTSPTSQPGPGSCTWQSCLMSGRARSSAGRWGTDLRAELVLNALNTALAQRRPQGVVHHSDRGCQYTSYAFGKRCREMNVMPSMGSVGDAYDNAMVESLFATLERELLDRRRLKTQSEARLAVFEWIEGWYNPHRRHWSLGPISPVSSKGDTSSPKRHSCTHKPSAKAGQVEVGTWSPLFVAVGFKPYASRVVITFFGIRMAEPL